VESAVTDDGAYVRHDGGTDRAIQHCSSGGSSATPVDPAGGDADPNDGGNRRQDNEPSVAVDPTNPNLVVAGWNDYCQTDLGAGWQGLAYSTDRGASWTDSVVPGYPADTSAEGMASPLYGTHTDAGDPLVAFDNDGRLFVGGIASTGSSPRTATYGWRPTATSRTRRGYPKDYLRTVIVGQGTPSEVIAGIFQDKPSLEVDRTGGPNDGNVYMCWSRFVGAAGRTKIYFSRSTDHGATFSRPTRPACSRASTPPSTPSTRPPGWSTSPYSSADPGFVGRSVVYVARSTNNGQTWGTPVKVDNAGGRGGPPSSPWKPAVSRGIVRRTQPGIGWP
jgi:hypothetical protein